ncbi:MAG: hypothetical protein U0U25_02700 [Flavobacteriales bacterium]
MVECDNDELLLRLLGVLLRKRIQHEGNREEVVHVLKQDPKREFVGSIDEDPDTTHGTSGAVSRTVWTGRCFAPARRTPAGGAAAHLEGWSIAAARRLRRPDERIGQGVERRPSARAP